MVNCSKCPSENDAFRTDILRLTCRIANPSNIVACSVYGDYASESSTAKAVAEVLLVVRGFQPKLMNYIRALNGKTIVTIAVDQWVFERDVDRGFLGEALAWGLVFPYLPLINEEYLHEQEVKLKRRLVLELLENLVLDFPELSHELHIEPEYFMYETIVRRARLFPPMISVLQNIARRDSKNMRPVLAGYLEALRDLERCGAIGFSNDYVRISEEFISGIQSPRTRLVNVSKAVPRTLFTSLLNIMPRLFESLSKNNEAFLQFLGFQAIVRKSPEHVTQVNVPESYLHIPTASGLVSLTNRMDIQAFARKVLRTGKDAEIKIKPIGGVLNDVYLVEVSEGSKKRKVIVKEFKDWSSFKWFPLSLWGVGTRRFSVLGRSRLEREYAINEFLHSKGFSVPNLLHVSPNQRLVFMEYIEGESATAILRKAARSKVVSETRKEMKVIERIGMKLARVHALGIALGDTKPENIMIGKHSEIYLMDFEQASRNGDRTWDVAEFLYYAGHDLPMLTETRQVELISRTFIKGYLEAGGEVETVRKAGTAKYTKVFSVFTLPHFMLAISNVLRRTKSD